MSEWQDGDLRFETITNEEAQNSSTLEIRGSLWTGVIDHKTNEIVAVFPSARDAFTYTGRLNAAYGAPLISDVRSSLDIAKRATAVERERCLSEVEALYIDLSMHVQGIKDRHTLAAFKTALIALRNVGMTIAGGDAGPHSGEALAWRAMVPGEKVPA